MDTNYQLIAKTIFSVLSPNNTHAYVFGSRALGTNRKNSDIDIALNSSSPIDKLKIIQIKDQLESSDLPFLVDIIDLSTTTNRFKSIALKKTIDLQKYL